MVTVVQYNCVLYCKKYNYGRFVVSIDSKERFLNKSAPLPAATQVPMIADGSNGDANGQVTANPASDSTNDSGVEAPSNRENNPGPSSDTGSSSKREMEESNFTKPQEDLLYID